MPVTHMPAGTPKGGQFAPGNSGGVSRVTRNTPERKALAAQIKIRRNLAKHYEKEGGAKPELIANLKKGVGIHGKTRGDIIRSVNNKGTAERNEKAATLRDERTRAQIRSKLGYKSAPPPPASAPAKPVDPGVAKIRALGEKFDKLQKASDTKNKVDEANRIERKTANVFADRARYAKEDATPVKLTRAMQKQREKLQNRREQAHSKDLKKKAAEYIKQNDLNEAAKPGRTPEQAMLLTKALRAARSKPRRRRG